MKLYAKTFDKIIEMFGKEKINNSWYKDEIKDKDVLALTEEEYSSFKGLYFLVKLDNDTYKIIGAHEKFYNHIDMKEFTAALKEFCKENNVKGKIQLESNYKNDKKYNELGYEFLKYGEITRWELVCDFYEEEGVEYEVPNSERHEWVKHKTSIYQIDIK